MAMTREEEEQRRIALARQNVEDWQKQFTGGLSGFVRVGSSEEAAQKWIIGDPVLAEKIESRTRLTAGIDPSAMFAERDRLRELAAECGDAMPTSAEITAQAVSNTKESAQ